ncbi:hypothetical protein CHUAL_001562 [Chamberlinius hualienensis]
MSTVLFHNQIHLHQHIIKNSEKKDSWAKVTILMTVEQHIQPSITDATISKEMWDHLQQMYEPQTAALVVKLFQDLFNIKYQPDSENMLQFVTRVKTLITSISKIGYQLPDCLHAFVLVQQLPPEFKSLVQQLYSMPDRVHFKESVVESKTTIGKYTDDLFY